MDIHHYIHPDNEVIYLLHQILNKERIIMATMQELNAAVQRNTDVEASVETMLQGISQQLKDAKASNDPAAIQAVIDQIDANTKRLSDAVTANTPAA